MTVRRIAPPPSDDQLAAAEQTDNVRRRDRLAQVEDEQEQERLAKAGDPEALEKVNARAAIRASASVLDSRPVGGSDDDNLREEPPAAHNNSVSKNAVKKRRHRSNDTNPEQSSRSRRRAIEAAPLPLQTPLEEEDPEAQRTSDEKLAYRLMDLAYKKWARDAPRDMPKANRALAIDLGKDAMLYLRSGIIRMNDLHATIEKLTASAKKGKDDEGEGEEDLDDQLEEMRKAMRGE